MAKIPRVVARIFGGSSGPSQIAQFGSLAAGSPNYTTNPTLIQGLSNWLTGWFGAVIGGNAPAIEDMNAFCYVMAYQIAYLMQAGVPEWDASTVYYTGSLANSNGTLYMSIQNDNTNHAVSDPAFWKAVGGDIMSALGDLVYGGAAGVQTVLPGNVTTTPAILAQTGNGSGSAAPVWRPLRAPKITVLSTPGSGTFSTTNSPLYLRIRLVAGGGGGGGSGTGNTAGAGGNGGNTIFGDQMTTTWVAANGGNGGNGGGGNGAQAEGGQAALGTSVQGFAAKGTAGAGIIPTSTDIASVRGSLGGASQMGGVTPSGDPEGTSYAGAGGAGGYTGGTPARPGCGGAAGGYAEGIISNPDASYPYEVGAQGSVGSAGTSGNAGMLGGWGQIVIEEHYQ